MISCLVRKRMIVYPIFMMLISFRSVAEPCPAGNFDDFSRLFIKDVDIQSKYSKGVVDISYHKVLDGDVEEIKKSRILRLSDFPIVSNSGVDGVREIEIDNKNLKVFVKGRDSGYQVSLSFSKTERCWHLVKLTDYSM